MSQKVDNKTVIWSRSFTLADLNALGKGNMLEHLGIEFIEIGSDYLKAKMPVNDKTRQPFGLLHGGASAVLSETMGSTGAHCCIDLDRQACVGIEVNANHLRSAREGYVIGTSRPLRLGRQTQVWETHIHDESGQLIAVSRLTLAVLSR